MVLCNAVEEHTSGCGEERTYYGAVAFFTDLKKWVLAIVGRHLDQGNSRIKS